MFTNMEDYEKRINELINQIAELQAQVYQFRDLIKEKDEQINQLYNQNQQLNAQIHSMQEVTQSPYYSQQAPQTPVSPQATHVTRQTENPAVTASTGEYLNKRECPKCGASGFAIKEVEDKSRLLSYVPRRIYAKKHVCTKCFYEW